MKVSPISIDVKAERNTQELNSWRKKKTAFGPTALQETRKRVAARWGEITVSSYIKRCARWEPSLIWGFLRIGLLGVLAASRCCFSAQKAFYFLHSKPLFLLISPRSKIPQCPAPKIQNPTEHTKINLVNAVRMPLYLTSPIHYLQQQHIQRTA